MAGLDAVYQLARFALGGHHVIPAAGNHQVLGKPEDPVCDGIAVVVVVKHPRVDFLLAQGSLDGRKVHGKALLYRTPYDFRESCSRRWRRSSESSASRKILE